jgi:predicted DNA-binding transcriptional regulator AlpA
MNAAQKYSPADLAKKSTLTVAEVVELTGFSRQTVTRMFEDEAGVLIINRPETMHKRSYRSIRIPRPVYERVVRRVAN